MTRNRTEEEGPLRAFVEEVHAMDPPPYRAPRTGVFLNANRETTPLALRANVEHNRIVHENVVIVCVADAAGPARPASERVTLDDLGYSDDGITHLTVRYGFQDTIDVPAHAARGAPRGWLEERGRPRRRLLLRLAHHDRRHRRAGDGAVAQEAVPAIARNAADPVPYFGLPDERTTVMGSHIEL